MNKIFVKRREVVISGSGSCHMPDFGINGVGPSVCSAAVSVIVTTAYLFIAKINTYWCVFLHRPIVTNAEYCHRAVCL
jgi:hypothetical protein